MKAEEGNMLYCCLLQLQRFCALHRIQLHLHIHLLNVSETAPSSTLTSFSHPYHPLVPNYAINVHFYNTDLICKLARQLELLSEMNTFASCHSLHMILLEYLVSGDFTILGVSC